MPKVQFFLRHELCRGPCNGYQGFSLHKDKHEVRTSEVWNLIHTLFTKLCIVGQSCAQQQGTSLQIAQKYFIWKLNPWTKISFTFWMTYETLLNLSKASIDFSSLKYEQKSLLVWLLGNLNWTRYVKAYISCPQHRTITLKPEESTMIIERLHQKN